MNGIGFLPLLWVNDALKAGLFPTTRAHTVATAIAEAADRDGRWCYLYLDTLTRRCGGTLSRSTAKRALRDLVHHHLVRKLPRTHLRTFFAHDLATGRRRADNLPDVLELLIPASAYTHHHPTVLEEINHARAQLGEEPLTPYNRPDLPVLKTPGRARPTRTTEAMGTTVHRDPSRRVTLNPREGSQRPTDPSPAHPHPSDPSPHPLRERSGTGPQTPDRPATSTPVPRPRTAPDTAPAATRTPEHAPAPRQAPDATHPAPVRPPARPPLPEPPTAQPHIPRPRTAPDATPPARPKPAPPNPRPRPAPAWAYDLLARIPDAALHHPHHDRDHLATRLACLHAAGVTHTALTHALTGWEHTTRPYAALRARLTTPDTLHAWNTHTLHRTPTESTPHPAPDHPAAFTLDTHGKATHTCPHHPTLRNTPGGTCTLCGHPCRTHPDHTPPPTKPAAPRHTGTLDRLLGPPGPDTRFTTPKCDDQRCNPDPHSPRYRTVLRRTPDDRTITTIPCPTCGEADGAPPGRHTRAPVTALTAPGGAET